MSTPPDPRLQRLLGGDALAALRKRLRQRYERADADSVAAVLRIAGLGETEHAALAALQGRPATPTGSMQLDLAFIDERLREAGIARSLRDALEQLDGPIVHTASARAELRARWSAVAAAGRQPALLALLSSPAGLGLLKRLTRSDSSVAVRCAEQADAVLQRLPAHGLPRAQLAAETLGDAHALDDGQRTATLVLAALRWGIAAERQARDPLSDRAAPSLATAVDETMDEDSAPAAVEGGERVGVEGGERADADLAAAAKERNRAVWAWAGVLVNELARPALFLNLPILARPGHPAAPSARTLLQPTTSPEATLTTDDANGSSVGRTPTPGEPAYASLRELLRAPPAWDVLGRTVFVCENPNLLAIAADQLGAACAPLVCTEGMPAAAQRSLLSQLTQAGARLRYHGDFDWAGLRIANHLMRQHGASPWRYAAADYEAAAAYRQGRAPRPGLSLGSLTGPAVPALWDADLAPAMQRLGIAIAEEALASDLLADLAPGTP